MVKNLPAHAVDAGNGVQFLGQEDPLGEEMATPSSILAYRIPWTAWWVAVRGVAKSQT